MSVLTMMKVSVNLQQPSVIIKYRLPAMKPAAIHLPLHILSNSASITMLVPIIFWDFPMMQTGRVLRSKCPPVKLGIFTV